MKGYDEPDCLRSRRDTSKGAGIVFDFKGQRFDVSIFPSPLTWAQDQGSLQDRLIATLARTKGKDIEAYFGMPYAERILFTFDEYDKLENEVLDVVMDAARPILEAQATQHWEPYSARDLHSVIYPEISYYQFLEIDGQGVLIPILPSEASTAPEPEISDDSALTDTWNVDKTLPCYSTRELLTVDLISQRSVCITGLVLAGSKVMFCKTDGSKGGLYGTGVGVELDALEKIRRLQLPPRALPLRVPQLTGYIYHADEDRVVGFLREWVRGHTLWDTSISATSVEQRQKWLRQMRETVRTLHSKHIVWGDAKPHNVVIDEQGDAWLINLGICWRKPWVHLESQPDTMERDEEAITKIG